MHRYAGAKFTVVDGLRVTTIPQSMFDVAMGGDPWRVERALDHSLLAQQAAIGEYEERLSFYDGSRRPGLPVIRRLILERTEDGFVPPESELEALLFAVLAQLPSRPRVIRQAPLPWRSSRPGRVDALLPDHQLIIEVDGRRWHTRVKDFDRDQWRNNEAVAHGHRVMRFTWVHIHDFASEVLDVVWRTISPSSAA